MRKTTKNATRSRGSIQARGKGKWLVRVFLGLDPATGKRKYASKVVTGTRREAERTLTEELGKVDRQEFVEPSKLTLQQYTERWLAAKEGEVATRTAIQYRDLMARYIFPALGSRKLDALTPVDVQDHFTALKATLGPRTVKYAHMVLKQCLEHAVQTGIIGRNSARHTKLASYESPEMRVLSPEQVQTFLGHTDGTPMHPLWVLLLTTGMRPQEALALRWDDLQGSSVSVRRALVRETHAHYVLGETKTKKSTRLVSLPSGTLAVLQQHRVRQLEHALKMGPAWDRTGNFIFTNSVGNHMDPAKVRKQWKKALQSAGLPEIRLYDSRHTHATLLLGAKTHPKVVADRLGHSTVMLTMNTYSHILPEIQKETADTVESLVFQPASAASN